MIVQLAHPSDPRFLLVDELPERVTIGDLGSWRYGKPLIVCPEGEVVVYEAAEGEAGEWVRPPAETVIADLTVDDKRVQIVTGRDASGDTYISLRPIGCNLAGEEPGLYYLTESGAAR